MRVFKYLLSVSILIFIILTSFSIGKVDYKNENIQVEVRGNVKKEIIVELKKGSTFNDLLEYIELNENADISNYSLNEPLSNKQIIIIGSNEIKKISINSATLEELCDLSGIGIKTAEAIIKYREEHNGFKYLEELMMIKGIGEKKFEKIKDQISL